MMITIDEATVIANFGSEDDLAKAVTAFQTAREAHAKTEGKPAPTAHAIVEAIVIRHAGKYEVERPGVVTATKRSKMPIEELRSTMLAELAQLRWSYANAGIGYNGMIIPSDAVTEGRLVAALAVAKGDPRYRLNWKVGARRFEQFSVSDIEEILRRIREHVQRAFDRERDLMATILDAKSVKALMAIDVGSVAE